MSLNNVCIMGRLTKAPELRHTQSGTAVATFSLAVERDFKDGSGERATDFFDVVAWKSTAEFVANYFGKGRVAVVMGRLQTRSWTDKDGNKRRAVEIIADRVYFGDSKTNSGTSEQGYTRGDYANTGENMGDFDELDDDGELPF